MEEKKMELTAELMGLRAGLSIISKYTDEIKRCQNDDKIASIETIKKEKKLQEKEEIYQYKKKDVAYQRAYCEKLKEEYKKISLMPFNNIVSDQVKRPIKPIYDEKNTGIVAWFLAALAALAFFTYFLILDVLRNELGFFGNESGAIPTIITVAVVFVLPLSHFIIFRPIVLFIRKMNYNKEMTRYKESVLELKDKEIQAAEAVLKNKIAYQNAVNAERTNAEHELKEQRKKENLVNQKNKEMICALSARSHAVNESLIETYGMVIMECDWQNIDLILHYFETGRADTLKEALQQVDRQRQTNQITSAINNARDSISNHIESAFSRMGKALAMSFNKLNDNISGITQQLAKNERIISEANLELVSRLDKQISTSEMQNALLEKANKSSDELLNDLRYNQKYWLK